MEFQKISEAEHEVMDVLWKQSQPMTSSQVIDILKKEKDWKQSTVWTFLGRLVEKNILLVEKDKRTNLYTPALSQKEYKAMETQSFLREVHSGSVSSFITSLSGGTELDQDEINELKHWIETL